MPLPAIDVLLATYNGERFLPEQIDSVLAQSGFAPGELRILVRDDGSKDNTTAILAEYAAKFPDQFHVLHQGLPTRSAALNFRELTRASSAPYLSFCDQDDIWLPSKLAHSLSQMRSLEQKHGMQTPLLVFSDLRVVDESLNTLHESFWKHEGLQPENIHHLNRLIGGNVVTGCTALINRPLANLLNDMPDNVPMHDRWMALLACALGAAAFLAEPTMLYRQHSANVVGATREAQTLASISERASHSDGRLAQWRISQTLAQQLLVRYGSAMPEQNRHILEAFRLCDSNPSRFARMFLMLRYRFFRSGLLRNLATLALVWNLDAENKSA